MDPETGGADLCLASRRLACFAEVAPPGGRRCACAQPRGRRRGREGFPSGNSQPVTIMNISRRSFVGMTAGASLLSAQEKQPIFRVKVDMVVLSFQITDNKNHYINGLKPTDFRIYEDGILQKISTFAEGAKAP